MKRLGKIILGIVMLLVIMKISDNDYHDAVMEQEHYCDMVASGAWPAYDGPCVK